MIEVIGSNGKPTGGRICFDDGMIKVYHSYKPLVSICDKNVVAQVTEMLRHNEGNMESGGNSTYKHLVFVETLEALYVKFQLLISEISSMCGMSYFKTNKLLKYVVGNGKGRHNSRYGVSLTEETRGKISIATTGRVSPMRGTEMSQETKDKISKRLKQLSREGRLDTSGDKQRAAWERGRYAEVKFGRGYQGYFSSIKFGVTLYFRSLLELNYLLVWENDSSIHSVIMEPMILKVNVGGFIRNYTPDALLNKLTLVEIKPKKHLSIHPQDSDRYLAEIIGAANYCEENGLEFIQLYDSDLNFETRKFKKYLKANFKDTIEKHNITFVNKEL